jgi:fluoroquinolone resistance protein
MDFSGTQKEYDSQDFKGLILRDGQMQGIEFVSCTFNKCSFRETTFKACKFNDCMIKGCDLSLVALKECYFKNTRFEDSQLIGVNWMDTNLANRKAVFGKPLDFFKCALNHSIFMGLNLKRLRLAHCLAVDVSFEEADLTGADCTFTDFKDSRFLHTNLTETDFTGAANYAIAANLNTLKKTRFSLPEAMSLLYSLDIVLAESRSMDEDDEL